MKNLFLFSFMVLFLFALTANAQVDRNREIWVDDMEKALIEPGRVYNLDLSKKGLDSIPEKIGQFYNLEALKLSDNYITEVGAELESLKKLKFLELSGNQLSTIDFGKFSDLKYSLQELWLRDNKIEELDSTINHLHALEKLDLGNNKLISISKKIRLPYLQSIRLDNNYLSEVPAMLQHSKKLRELNINANEVQSIKIGRGLRNLEMLNLGDNPIQRIDIEPGGYKLETLILDWVDLKDKDLSVLPNSIRFLSVEHCNLNALPPAFLSLRKLEELSLMHNEIQELPVDLAEMSRMKKIWINGNPLKEEYLRTFLNRAEKLEVVY